MQGNTEEKEKCLEKLTQMQKFIPFLDFMIDKIKKKNNEIPLECQLSKFQLLRSMIAEKSGKYSWDAIVKVEDVIEKLISKLDFKEQYEKSKEHLVKLDSKSNKNSMSTSLSIVPSSTAGVSVTTTSTDTTNTQLTESDIKRQDYPNTTVDLLKKTMKLSVEGNAKKNTVRDKELLANPLGPNQPLDVSGEIMETDLEKDLDGFDLTDCPNLSETDSSIAAVVPVSEISEKPSSHGDLLSSSREKLLKSLQSKLVQCRTNLPASQSAASDKAEKAGDTQISSAFSRSQVNPSEQKSDVSDSGDHSSIEKNKKVELAGKATGKQLPVTAKSAKPVSFPEKNRTESANGSGDVSSKQKLREKLSTDICEVYKVGKSVGGSLRSLKESSKDHKKNSVVEEGKASKSDKTSEKALSKLNNVSQSKPPFSQQRDSHGDKSHRESSRSEERRERHQKEETSHQHNTSSSHKSESNQKKSSGKDGERSEKKVEDKTFEADKLNDDELLEFVKENMQSLPHLAKLKPTELRKAVQSSLASMSSAVNQDAISDISDDSLQDLDEFVSETPKKSTRKSKTKDLHPLASVKASDVGFDGIAKNVKGIVEPSKDIKNLDEIGDKTHDLDDISFDEEDYALKLIEETTPKTSTEKAKKGPLDLPTPITEDLFEDISSIESFEPSSSPKLGKTLLENKDKLKPNSKPESNPQGNKVWSSSSHTTTNHPKDLSQSSSSNAEITYSKDSAQSFNSSLESKDSNKLSNSHTASSISKNSSQPCSGPTNVPADNNKTPHIGQGRLDPRLNKPPASLSQSASQYPPLIRIPIETNASPFPKPPVTLHVKDPRRHSYPSSEPKSYAEYKRLKQEKLGNRGQFSKEIQKSALPDSTNCPDASRTLVAKEVDRNTLKTYSGPNHSGHKNPIGKQGNPKKRSIRTYQPRKNLSHSKPRRYSSAEENRTESEKRGSTESEELVSPLEELYRSESKAKTGRGYGIQNFKIPKKVAKPVSQSPSKWNKNHPPSTPTKNSGETDIWENWDSQPSNSATKNDGNSEPYVWENWENWDDDPKNEPEKVEPSQLNANDSSEKLHPTDNSVVTSTCSDSVANNEKLKSSEDYKKTDSSISEKDSLSCDKAGPSETLSKPENSASVDAPGTPAIDKTDTVQEFSTTKDDAGEPNISKETEAVTEDVEKCKAQAVECDSNVKSSAPSEQTAEKDSSGDKGTPMPKEEITQEFVESLIRKSFQSGEGKLLLAQVKLFEELARKLNSKKLKTIQKIINSESGSSSSSSSEDSSEDEKKKKKSKKSEQKSKKRKKKGKKSRKHKLLSTSSSSETEEFVEEGESEKKENKAVNKKSVSSASTDNAETASTSESKSKESSPVPKTNRKGRKNVEVGKQFSKRKAKRKQKQKQLLEEILNESPQPEGSNDSNSPTDVPPKSKPKPKAKVKTELDRLHDDIRSMFISAGVVTATGKRMCRILKQSGGNMNNLDIVKESAKMVEEEKLKKGQSRTSPRNSRATNAGGSENIGRSESLDKGIKVQLENEEEQDPKLKLRAYVSLQRVDLDNFGYGVKISENCISFRRMQGRNMAIRSSNTKFGSIRCSDTCNVFLARNKRKYERLKDSKRKKGYVGKKLMDIVKNLPLKMAKMKHLQICEKKAEGEVTNKKKKNQPEKLSKKRGIQKKGPAKVRFNISDLVNYAFEKKRRMYLCRLCSRATRNITAHYQEVHPEHEVLISRLCLEEAKAAKMEATKRKDDSMSIEGGKRKVKALPRRPITYNCRMCRFSKVDDITGFASHVSGHTGEARFQCPGEGCNTPMHSREDLKFHILTKHPRNRYEFYNKIVELYALTIEDGKLFGFLCSVCHFVQMYYGNLENHISRQHYSSENAEILKINMSSKKSIRNRKRNLKGGFKEACNNTGSEAEESKKSEGETESNSEVQKLKITCTSGSGANVKVQAKGKKRKKSEDESSGECESTEMEVAETKKIFLDENAEVLEFKCRSSDDANENEEVDVEDRKNVGDDDCDNLNNDMEDCVDLKNISALKGSDIISSVENTDASDCPKINDSRCKLKVGPLEASLSTNSEVLYECFVKGCLFSTRVFDLFEKHIKISHWKTKWNGICDICCTKTENPSRDEENSFRLLTALKHLKLHEREINGGGKLSTQDLIMELKLLSPSDEPNATNIEEDKSVIHVETKTESYESPYPVKPLLRVRNLLGDRLSTPKAEEGDLVAMNEDSNSTESTDSSKMFTIENVRSLTESTPGENEIKIEQVCSLKDLMSKSKQQLGTANTIIVRSCPTRKIAIRPEPSTLSVDVGQINVIQSPVVAHPVVLSPISGTSPIRIISTALSPKPKLAVKPIVVSTDSVRLSTPNLMPVIRPSLSVSPATTATLIPVTTEIKSPSQKSTQESESGENAGGITPSLEIEVIKSPTRSKSPTTPSATIHHYPKNSPSDVEEDDKEAGSAQRMATSPSTGKKSVKDAKIYQEMLTKPKLCHLFKCMGIECSFTCNNENVFTQHIGLHEAQMRLRRDKGVKTIYLRTANKTTRAYYWQQCAYCCEVLSNTNKALSQHILEEHGHCMYQCAFCFYRAISHCYVEIHQNLAHSQILKTTPRLIYKCKPLKVPPSQFVALEKHGRKQSVRPYHCDQCGRKFFITQEFTNHLATEHQSVTAYTCHICKNLCFKINRLINHYKLHSYSTYQCAYCLHGTETEKEMIFHLCNFHFSQPAVMYVRALAEGQSDEETVKPIKKKKHLSNQLDSLKVIVYESDTPNLDCIVDGKPEEDIPDNISESSLDLSSIVAELGIYTDPQSSTGVTPLMKELASIGDKSGKNLTVKSLLPNAQFSSENESGAETCSVLISSGLSIPSDANNEREMSIPLGQLPLEAVNVQHKEATSPTPVQNDAGTPDRNLKLNEIIVNLQHKDKALVLPPAEEEKVCQPSAVILSSAVHKLPPVVLGRTSVLKSSYISKAVAVKRKSEESSESTEGGKVLNKDGKTESGSDKSKEDASNSKGDAESSRRVSADEGNSSATVPSDGQPLITNVVSLSKTEFNTEDSTGTEGDSIVISEVCSLSSTPSDTPSSSTVTVNIKTNVNVPSLLKPPIIRVEDFPMDEDTSSATLKSAESATVEPNTADSTKDAEKEVGKAQDCRPPSPDVIILESKAKDIVMVTLDSDDEKDEKKTESSTKDSKEVPNSCSGNETIRKEMELLRKQMVNETDSLLLDESEAQKPASDLTLNIQPTTENDSKEETLLSPIEEAICSLNKKLQSETQEAQKKEEVKQVEESPIKSDAEENKFPDRPRTRFGARDRSRGVVEGTDKSDGDEDKKEDSGKVKKFKEDLSGKELYICGNEKCNFAADDDSSLRDHLYVCDLSRESSTLLCPHCSRPFKQFHAYLEHLKYHGEKKFHCGLCSYSSAVDTSVSRHVKLKHKCSVLKILVMESKDGHLAYYPKNYKVEKIDFEVNGYSPGDEDKLPLQSVYQVNVKCAKCPYFTKVRSNMVRHLKIHVKSVETEGVVVVPSTAPTNPVPCLETKERMFDKMTNLAASSQLAQAKEKVAIESLSPEEEAKLPQFVTEQMRYKCCLPDCNYITVDDGMLKHHIKALHDEMNYYSCPHCRATVHADVRHVTLDKIGFHLKHHDTKLYKCAHCIFFHYQKNVVEKHTVEKHPDRRYFVHTVREPKVEAPTEEEPPSTEIGARVWKCGLCDDFQSISKSTIMDHLLKSHNTKSKYKCQMCAMKGNSYQAFSNHFASKHPGEKVQYVKVYYSDKAPSNYLESGNSSGADSSNEHFDTTPLWQRGAPRVRHIRGILIEEEEIKTKKSKKTSICESEAETSEAVNVNENAFYCPLCTNKKKPFFTRNEEFFRTHLYQELNYQQFACILCGKMFVEKKDFERHHARVHGDKPQSLKQTKEDHEIMFWVDQVIAKQRKQMEERKRKLSDGEASASQGAPKKKKEG